MVPEESKDDKPTKKKVFVSTACEPIDFDVQPKKSKRVACTMYNPVEFGKSKNKQRTQVQNMQTPEECEMSIEKTSKKRTIQLSTTSNTIHTINTV